MKSGHSKFNCKNRVKCFKCNTFSHHTALCGNEGKTKNSDDKKGYPRIRMINKKLNIIF